MKKFFNLFFLLFICFAYAISSDKSASVMNQAIQEEQQKAENQLVIVIDPGHGGRDPGKVGVHNILEKDVNLSISLKLKNLLEQNDIKVIMTRDTDTGLHNEGDSYKKRADMAARVQIIKESKADLAVSIHQNSFTEEYVKGAQVFYYDKSSQGRQLAEMLQKQIVETIADGNHRKAKPNDTYYMLKNTECPLAIVECGYLTNFREAGLLTDDSYQERMAYAIHLALIQFINDGGLNREEKKSS